jgi:dihydroorotate dehydrogenase (fumarate)
MDLRTTYLGLELSSPIVVSASTLSQETHNIAEMEENGAGAVVLFSLFEEQIRAEAARYSSVRNATSNMFAEASDFFPNLENYPTGTEEYLEKIWAAKAEVEIPIIASLNGITSEGWIEYSRQIEQAGADALEINIFFIPGDVHVSASEVEHRYLNIITEVRNTVKIPIAVKLNPYFSSTGNMAMRMQKAGADGLVLFNRFYQPDFDIHELKILSNLQYSGSNEIRLPLLWIAMLYGRVPVSLAATTGVETANEVIKYLLAGADVAMTASALYKNGIGYLKTMKNDLDQWMEDMDFGSVKDFKGILSQQNISDPTAFERANYIKVLQSKR